MSITEVGCMGVKPNLDIMDSSTPEGQVLPKAWNAVLSAPGGPSRVYWGLEIDDPSRVWAFFDWDSIEAHERFAKMFGAEAVKDFPSILTHGEFTKHIATTTPSSLRRVLLSPVTEVILAYVSSDVSLADKKVAVAQIELSTNKSLSDRARVRCASYAWGVENDFPVRGGEEGQKGSVAAAFFGWASIDASMKFRETETFKEIMDSIRGTEGIVKAAVVRISCRSLERKTE